MSAWGYEMSDWSLRGALSKVTGVVTGAVTGAGNGLSHVMAAVLPKRVVCAAYQRTRGVCPDGGKCTFHHPEIADLLPVPGNLDLMQEVFLDNSSTSSLVSTPPMSVASQDACDGQPWIRALRATIRESPSLSKKFTGEKFSAELLNAVGPQLAANAQAAVDRMVAAQVVSLCIVCDTTNR
jgi:hypothetical protein